MYTLNEPSATPTKWLAYGIALLALPGLVSAIWTLSQLTTLPSPVIDRFFADEWPVEFGKAGAPLEPYEAMWCFHETQKVPGGGITIERYGLLGDGGGQLERYGVFEDFSDRGFDDDAETRFLEAADSISCKLELTRARANLLRYGGVALLMVLAGGLALVGGLRFGRQRRQGLLSLIALVTASIGAFVIVHNVLLLFPAAGGLLWIVALQWRRRNV
jgi:hypothetical protein